MQYFLHHYRGTQSSRLVQAFSSHAAEMEIEPKEPFMLAANALQELHVGVRPLTPGGKFLYLNVVDIEYHQLVGGCSHFYTSIFKPFVLQRGLCMNKY